MSDKLVVDERSLWNAFSAFLLSPGYTESLVRKAKAWISCGVYTDFRTGQRYVDSECWAKAMRDMGQIPLGGRHNWQRKRDFQMSMDRAIKEVT